MLNDFGYFIKLEQDPKSQTKGTHRWFLLNCTC